jgi:hypothetical protein
VVEIPSTRLTLAEQLRFNLWANTLEFGRCKNKCKLLRQAHGLLFQRPCQLIIWLLLEVVAVDMLLREPVLLVEVAQAVF